MCICQIRAISIDSRFALDVLKQEGAERVLEHKRYEDKYWRAKVWNNIKKSGQLGNERLLDSDEKPFRLRRIFHCFM